MQWWRRISAQLLFLGSAQNQAWRWRKTFRRSSVLSVRRRCVALGTTRRGCDSQNHYEVPRHRIGKIERAITAVDFGMEKSRFLSREECRGAHERLWLVELAGKAFESASAARKGGRVPKTEGRPNCDLSRMARRLADERDSLVVSKATSLASSSCTADEDADTGIPLCCKSSASVWLLP